MTRSPSKFPEIPFSKTFGLESVVDRLSEAVICKSCQYVEVLSPVAFKPVTAKKLVFRGCEQSLTGPYSHQRRLEA